MTPQEALESVNRRLKPKSLNYIQELVFLQSWSGKIYREIAIESGYDLDYIKEVGAQLWQLISEALGEKVTKKNVQLVLNNLPSQSSLNLLERRSATALDPEISEFPTGPIPHYSGLYIDRPPIEELALTEINRPGSLIRIKAPQQTGKTSLVLRILAHTRALGFSTVMLNFQQADSSVLLDLDTFLRWFCLNATRQLNLEPKLDQFWNKEIGSKISCTEYFQNYLLEQTDCPIVVAIDEIHCIFDYPILAQDFLALLRSWYETAAELKIWQKLRLIVVYNTEIPVPLQISQSPFNVGLPLQLPEFTLQQTQALASIQGLNDSDISIHDLKRLMQLVGGHPYLLRHAFYWLKQRQMPLEELLQTAPTQAGIYSNHLRRHWDLLRQEPTLWKAFHKVVTAATSVQLDAIAAYRLESMRLIKLNGNEATPSCELYQLYFSAQSLDSPED